MCRRLKEQFELLRIDDLGRLVDDRDVVFLFLFGDDTASQSVCLSGITYQQCHLDFGYLRQGLSQADSIGPSAHQFSW